MDRLYAIIYPHDNIYNSDTYGIIGDKEDGSWEIVKDGFKSYDEADTYVKDVLKENGVLNDIPF